MFYMSAALIISSLLVSNVILSNTANAKSPKCLKYYKTNFPIYKGVSDTLSDLKQKAAEIQEAKTLIAEASVLLEEMRKIFVHAKKKGNSPPLARKKQCDKEPQKVAAIEAKIKPIFSKLQRFIDAKNAQATLPKCLDFYSKNIHKFSVQVKKVISLANELNRVIGESAPSSDRSQNIVQLEKLSKAHVYVSEIDTLLDQAKKKGSSPPLPEGQQCKDEPAKLKTLEDKIEAIFVDVQKFIDMKDAESAADAEKEREKEKARKVRFLNRPLFSKTYLAIVVEGDKGHGFLVEMIAEKKSGVVTESAGTAYLHTDKLPKDIKIGHYLDIEKIKKSLVQAGEFGKQRYIATKPLIIDKSSGSQHVDKGLDELD